LPEDRERQISGLMSLGRQHNFVAILPADEQYSMPYLFSALSIETKPAIKRMAVQIGSSTSQLVTVQGTSAANALHHD